MAKYDLVRSTFAVIADDPTVYRVTRIVSKTHTLKITRQAKPRSRAPQEAYILTVGRPNYAERQFIKNAVLAGEPFPIKKVLVRRYPSVKV